MQVLQRLDWHGSPIELGELFIMRKNGREATCKLRSHEFGWELLLVVGRPRAVNSAYNLNQNRNRATNVQ
jgi:hypothetical protein